MTSLLSIGQENPLSEVGWVAITIGHSLDDLNTIILALQEAISVGMVKVVQNLLAPDMEHGE